MAFYILFITYAEAIDFRSWCDNEWTRLTGNTGKDSIHLFAVDLIFWFFFPTWRYLCSVYGRSLTQVRLVDVLLNILVLRKYFL